MSDAPDIKKYVDMDGAMARMRGNATLYRKMLQLFMKSTEFDAFENSMNAGDLEKAGEAAHAIKGMTGNLSMPTLFELSTQLMNQLRAGSCDEKLLDDYREALTLTRRYVDDIAQRIDTGSI